MSEARQARRPLTGAQLGIWFAQQLDPESPMFNTGEYIDIHGPLDPVRFEAALRQTVAEAETLHLRFGEDGDGPWQRLEPSSDWVLHHVDFSGSDHPLEAAEAWMRQDLAEPIDLTRGPLFTEALFKLAPDRFLWYQRIHHLVIDGYSFSLLAQRAAQIYTALTRDQPPGPEAFGALQSILREDDAYRASEQQERDRAFWLARFADAPEAVSLGSRAARAGAGFLRRT
ncbi:condensation domain-containing protein, partial [Paenibacillus ehimensis]